jgi:hypothetical protein
MNMPSSERGSALVIVLLMLMLMSAIAAALGTAGQTETLISRNHRSHAQAELAAEAGLNHGTAIASDYIFSWKSHNCGGAAASTAAGVAAAITTLLQGPAAGNCNVDGSDGSLASFLTVKGIPVSADAGARDVTDLSVSGADDCSELATSCYEVTITDDAEADGDLTTDTNGSIVIQATGYGADDTKVTLESLISPLSLQAIVTNGNFTLGGNAKIKGSSGTIHSNGNITVSGTSATVTGSVSASGTYTAPVGSTVSGSGGTAQVHVPTISAADYLVWADYILDASGNMYTAANYPSGSASCSSDGKTSCNNWTYASGTWTLNSSTVPSGTYYVAGNAAVSGSPGSTKSPAALSIIATGNIQIAGSPKLAPDTPELLFVTEGDLKITGSLDEVGVSATIQGQMLVHGQAEIAGNASLDGQLIVEDAAVGSLVTANSMTGSSDLTYSGSLGTATYTVSGWREVR